MLASNTRQDRARLPDQTWKMGGDEYEPPGQTSRP